MTDKDKMEMNDLTKPKQGSDEDIAKRVHVLLVEKILAYLEGSTTLAYVFALSETLYAMDHPLSLVVRKALERLHELKEKIEKKDKLTDTEKENVTYMLNAILNELTSIPVRQV